MRARVLLILAGLYLALAGCSNAPPNCAIHPVTRLDFQEMGGLPIVEVQINGRPVKMIVDTGAQRTLLTEAAAKRLDLPVDIGRFSQTVGVGGPTTEWDVKLDQLVVGGVRFPVERMAVSGFNIPSRDGDAPEGLLGADILLGFDLDIDFSAGAITLYSARRCQDAKPPWNVPVIAITAYRKQDRILIPLQLDGVAARGLLDTGAEKTTLGSSLAERLGVTDGVMQPDPVVMQNGTGPSAVESRLHRFRSLTIGPAVTLGPMLPVLSSDFGIGDALIGQDFLKGRRVWISFATNLVFVTRLPGDAAIKPTADPADLRVSR
jgi:predicted aspartyl protease